MKKVYKVLIGLASFIICQVLVFFALNTDHPIKNAVPHQHDNSKPTEKQVVLNKNLNKPTEKQVVPINNPNKPDAKENAKVVDDSSQLELTEVQLFLLKHHTGQTDPYNVIDNSSIKCDQDRVLPLKFLNDDYCDCSDHTDEPATSACYQGVFMCTTQSKSKTSRTRIPSSQVNDGYCDCCDGSDEWRNPEICNANNC